MPKHSIQICILLLCSLAVLLAADPLVSCPDLGWHIRAGEKILATRSLPYTAWFSFTVPNHPWVNHEWLQDIGLYVLWQSGGSWGVRIGFALLGWGLIILVFNSFNEGRRSWELTAVTGVLWAGILVAARLLRPQLITLLGFALVWLLLRRLPRTAAARSLWLLPPFFWLWANLHAGFVIGIALAALVLAVEALKLRLLERGPKDSFLTAWIIPQESLTIQQCWKLFGILILSGALTLVNPYGWRLYAEIFQTLGDRYPKLYVTEWLPTSVAALSGELFFCFVAAALVLMAARVRRPDLTFFIALLAFFGLGLTSVRHSIFFVIILLPELYSALKAATPLLRREFNFIFFLMLGMIILALSGNLLSRALPSTQRVVRVEEMYPLKALAFLDGAEVGRRVFHAFEWGGFLILHNGNNQTFIDGRMTQWQVDDRSFLRTYVEVKNLASGWQETLQRYGVDLVLIAPQEPLAAGLRLLPQQWRLLYEDQVAIVFERIG